MEYTDAGELLHYYYGITKSFWPEFSYAWLAQKTGLSKSLLVGVFNGEKKLTMNTLNLLASNLQFPVELKTYIEELIADTVNPEVLKNRRHRFWDQLVSTTDFNRDITDSQFPILYAALGNQERGASVEEIRKKINWDEDRIRYLLKELILKKFVDEISPGYFRGTQFFIDCLAREGDSWLPGFFLQTLRSHLELAEKDFFDKQNLSLVLSFCVDQSSLKELREELRSEITRVVTKYHRGDAELITSVVLGMHPHKS